MREEDREMLRVEAENRMRNLVWTVSGDYEMPVQPDVELFLRSPNRGRYRAVCEGGFFRLYEGNEMSLYIMKKLYLGADDKELGRIVRLCMDASVQEILQREWAGVRGIRRRAVEDFLEEEYASCSRTAVGRLMLAYYGRLTGGDNRTDAETTGLLQRLDALGIEGEAADGKRSARPVMEAVDEIYNRLADPDFERCHGDLEQVLSVSLQELAEADFNWQDFLTEGAEQIFPEGQVVPPGTGQPEEIRRKREASAVQVDEQMRKKAYTYMELNYGRSYMKPLEQKRMNYTLCRDTHAGCRLYFTDGILHNTVRRNYQSEYVRQQHEFNRTVYRRSRKVASRNISQLADMLRQALMRRLEEDRVRSDTGDVVPRKLWKVGRTGDSRLFERRTKRLGGDFVVDVLMDASGSQRERRGDVAVQSFILSEALSIAGIPHRVQSFCTCWDYTILERFREYDDPREKNQRIFEYSTSANNRDGLAIRTVVHTLLQRPEENKILIILSDGRPNDRIVNRSVSRAPALYVGEFAVHDTAEEVRRARNAGIAVLGVFAGQEEDLEAEKKIFGRDFAYIRDIRRFSPTVGRYLRRQLDAL